MATNSLANRPDYSHYIFACELVRGLNKFYSVTLEWPDINEKDRYYTESIHWGIITLSYLFRKEYFRIFGGLGRNLKSIRSFQKCCYLIPVKRNDLFFFNYLKRISLIYEMLIFCYRRGNNYFEIIEHCIAGFNEEDYFYSNGSWPRLNQIAQFLAQVGRPLRPLIMEERNLRYPINFPLIVNIIERRLKAQREEGKLKSRHMRFLIEQKNKFVTRDKIPVERSAEYICLQPETSATISQPGTSSSTVSQPGTSSATVSQPGTTSAAVSQPGTSSAAISQPRTSSAICFRSFVKQTSETKQIITVEEEKKAIVRYFAKYLPPAFYKLYEKLSESKRVESGESDKSDKSWETINSSENNFEREDLIRSFEEKLLIQSDFKSSIIDDDDDDEVITLPSRHSKLFDCTGSIYEPYVPQYVYPKDGNIEEQKRKLELLEDDLYLSEISDDENVRYNAEHKSYTDSKYLFVDRSLYSNTNLDISESQSPRNTSSPSSEGISYLKELEDDLYYQSKLYSSPYTSDTEIFQHYSDVESISTSKYSIMRKNAIYTSSGTLSPDDISLIDSTLIESDIMHLPDFTSSSLEAAYDATSYSSSNTDVEFQDTSNKSEKPNIKITAAQYKNSKNSEALPKPKKRKSKRRKKRGKGKK